MYALLLTTAIWLRAVQGHNEIGCFIDSGEELILENNQPVSLNQRALSGSFHRNRHMDVEECLSYCSDRGYRYAGLQVGYECFCGDYGYDKHGAAPASECNKICTGNHAQMCGGDWRLSVYETGVNSEYVILSDVNVSHTWQETKELCNQKQMTLPTFNESTLTLFIERNQAFKRTNIWQDGRCYLNASCVSERHGKFNPPERTGRDNATYTCLSYHIDITDKTKLKLKAITCDSAPPMLHPVCQKYNYNVTPEALTCPERHIAVTCPEKQVALTSPENGLATFQLQFGDQDLNLNLPVGQYQHSIKTADQSCNVTMIAEDYRVRRRLELVADYSVDCSALTSTVTRSLLDDIAQQKYTVIDALCGSVCKRPADNAQPVLSCDGVNGLKIRWPTDLVYTADVVSVPTKILQTLKNKIKARGATLNVVVFGATPPIIFPRKVANGGYVSISMSTTCIEGLTFSEIDKKCV